MSNDIYSRSEIEFIDGLFSYSRCEDVTRIKIRIKEVELLDWFSSDDLLQLRIKGVINTEKINYQESQFEDSLETITSKEEVYILINEEELIRKWIFTLFSLVGKVLTSEIILQKKSGYFYSEFDLGENIKHEINFIVNKNIVKTKGVSISFINEVNKDIYENLTFWDEPIVNNASANSFFQRLVEEQRLLSNKNYNFINVPVYLEAIELEGFKKVIKTYLNKLGYRPQNHSKYFRPESIDFSIPDEMISEVYIHEEQKIFFVENGKRIELHIFENGIKRSNEVISYHVGKMKDLVEDKVKVYDLNKQRKSNNFIKDFKVLLALISSIVLSAITSLKILFTSDITHLMKSKIFLYTHIGISSVTILLLIFFGFYPQIRLYFFSWERNVSKRVKKYIKEYKELHSPD